MHGFHERIETMTVAAIGKLVDETGDGMITVGAAYDAALVAAIKAMFYPEERRWIPDRKIWAIAEYRRTELLALLRLQGYLVQESAEVVVLESRSTYSSEQARISAEQSRAKAKAAKEASRARALREQSGQPRLGQAELFLSSAKR
jgi:hypothetical protein